MANEIKRTNTLDPERDQTFTTGAKREASTDSRSSSSLNRPSAFSTLGIGGEGFWALLGWNTPNGQGSTTGGSSARNTSVSGDVAMRASSASANDGRATEGGESVSGEDLGMLDEETWHWPTLIARIFSFFLLALILACIGLEEITDRFLILAAMICVFLALVILVTYDRPRKFIIGCLCGCCRKEEEREGSSANSATSGASSVRNPILKTGAAGV